MLVHRQAKSREILESISACVGIGKLVQLNKPNRLDVKLPQASHPVNRAGPNPTMPPKPKRRGLRTSPHSIKVFLLEEEHNFVPINHKNRNKLLIQRK